MNNNWSPVPLAICEVCGFLWCILTIGTCTYLVFILNHSGWWFVLAVFLASIWSCKGLRSPDQLKVSNYNDDD